MAQELFVLVIEMIVISINVMFCCMYAISVFCLILSVLFKIIILKYVHL